MGLKDTLRTFRRAAPKITLNYSHSYLLHAPMVQKPSDAVELFRASFQDESWELKEHLWVLILDKASRVLGITQVSVGDFNRVQMNTREIVQTALLANAASVVLAHNHPSSLIEPSEGDIKSTTEIKLALDLFEINLKDHFILSRTEFSSMKNLGLIP